MPNRRFPVLVCAAPRLQCELSGRTHRTGSSSSAASSAGSSASGTSGAWVRGRNRRVAFARRRLEFAQVYLQNDRR